MDCCQMTTAAMLLILTNSYDGTTDLLINRLSAGKVFRLNCDLLPAYKIEVTNDGFIVEDSTGRLIKSHQITKLYFRKPWVDSINHSPASDGTDKFCNAELRYLIAEIVNILWIQGKIVLVEPYAERRCGKFIQLMIAKNYFDVPDWIFTFHTLAASRTKSQIVKALSGEQVSK